MKTSIIIPTHNRENNIRCVIASLRNQIPSLAEQDVELIVVDDRSTDNTYQAIWFENSVHKFPIKYIYIPQTHTDWNASIPRNTGAKATRRDTELLWFLDSDVILPPDAVRITLDTFCAGEQNRVMVGRYHWLRGQKIVAQDIFDKYEQVIHNQFEELPVDHPMQGKEDIRKTSFEKAKTSQEMFHSFTDGLACFGGYLLIPKKVFFMAGGYDEEIGAGCEDGDFGITLYEMGIPVSYLQETWGYHLAHNWPKGRDSQIIKQNVEKLDKKHSVDLIHESGKAYRQWGIDWQPDPILYDYDEEKFAKYKREWKFEKVDLTLKVNKV